MPDENSLGRRIASARKRSEGKLTQAQVAEALGVTAQAVSGWERGESRPDLDKMYTLSRLLGTSIAWLLDGADERLKESMVNEMAEDYQARTHFDARDPKWQRSLLAEQLARGPLNGLADFPIYFSKPALNGQMVIEARPVQHVRRPILLEGSKEAYGVLIQTSDMQPAYRARDLILVNPELVPEPQSDVILCEGSPTFKPVRAMLRRLIAADEQQLTVERFNPAETAKAIRSEWAICHMVVGRLVASAYLK